jgi:hypothetical protein
MDIQEQPVLLIRVALQKMRAVAAAVASTAAVVVEIITAAVVALATLHS